MNRSRHPDGSRYRSAGFTLLELMVVIVIIGISLAIGLPAFLGFVARNQLTSATREVTTLFQKARIEAIRRSQPTVVRPDYDTRELVVWVNSARGADGLYTNLDQEPFPTELEIARAALPGQVDFWGPADSSPGGVDANTFPGPSGSPNLAPSPPFAANLRLTGAVFLSDGTGVAEGAIRLADRQGRNFFEVRLAPRATAHVSVRMYNPSGPITGEQWYEKAIAANGRSTWEWR